MRVAEDRARWRIKISKNINKLDLKFFFKQSIRLKYQLFYFFKWKLMLTFNLLQIEQAVFEVMPSKPSLYYQKYKNGQFTTMNISLTIRDRRIFDIPLERAKLSTNITKISFCQIVL
jgi:hypothetical protein